MKQRVCALLLALALTMGLSAPALAAEGDLFPAIETMPAFTDVAEGGGTSGTWYDYDSIRVCVEAGLMKGTGDGFAPAAVLTVAEVATVCARIYEKTGGVPVPAAAKDEPWYAPSITVMELLGVDMPDSPLAPASRAVFVGMLAAVVPYDMLLPINAITSIPDTSDIDVLAFYNAGIVTGGDQYGSFTGDRNLTRAEAAAMIARIVRPSLRREFTLENQPPAQRAGHMVTALLGVDPATTILTVNGVDVPAQEYLYWMVTTIDALEAYLGGGSIDWNATPDGQPMSDFMKEAALDAVVRYYVVEAEAAKAGLTLSSGELAEVEAQINFGRETYGEEGYQELLQSMCLDEDGYRHIQTVNALAGVLREHLFPTPDQKELDAYAQENGILKAKHILVSDQALAEDLLAQLKAAGNSEETFDALAEEYSEDGRNANGKLAAPEGYVFKPGEMVDAFEKGTQALEPGEISGLVKSEYGYHIILRLPLRADDVYSLSYGVTIRDEWANTRFMAFLEGKEAQAKVETTSLYDNLDAQTFWMTLTALRAA